MNRLFAVSGLTVEKSYGIPVRAAQDTIITKRGFHWMSYPKDK